MTRPHPPRPPAEARKRLEAALEELRQLVERLRDRKGTTPELQRLLAEIARSRDALDASIQHHPDDVVPSDPARDETRRDRKRR